MDLSGEARVRHTRRVKAGGWSRQLQPYHGLASEVPYGDEPHFPPDGFIAADRAFARTAVQTRCRRRWRRWLGSPTSVFVVDADHSAAVALRLDDRERHAGGRVAHGATLIAACRTGRRERQGRARDRDRAARLLNLSTRFVERVERERGGRYRGDHHTAELGGERDASVAAIDFPAHQVVCPRHDVAAVRGRNLPDPLRFLNAVAGRRQRVAGRATARARAVSAGRAGAACTSRCPACSGASATGARRAATRPPAGSGEFTKASAQAALAAGACPRAQIARISA